MQASHDFLLFPINVDHCVSYIRICSCYLMNRVCFIPVINLVISFKSAKNVGIATIVYPKSVEINIIHLYSKECNDSSTNMEMEDNDSDRWKLLGQIFTGFLSGYISRLVAKLCRFDFKSH